MCVAGLLLTMTSLAYGSDIYFASSAAGSANGSACADAYAVSGINTASYWVAGNNIHLCGTITGAANSTLITPPGNGSSGSPITIVFESGAVLTAAYWNANGAIYINGKSYITVNGGTNGIITNSSNGSLSGSTCGGSNCSYDSSSSGITINSANNITVENLTIQKIYNEYASASGSDTSGANTNDISITDSGSNITIFNNILNNSRTGIDWEMSGTISGVNIYNNTITDHGWSMHLGDNDSSGYTMSNFNIYGNTITGWSNWGNGAGSYHTDGIMMSQALGYSYSPRIYNNYIYGDLGSYSPTAFIFCTYGNGSSGTTSGGCIIYNNVIVHTGPNGDYGLIWLQTNTTGHQVYNNTIVGYTGTQDIGVNTSGTGQKMGNNIFVNVSSPMGSYDTSLTGMMTSCDYNVYYGINTARAVSYNMGGSGVDESFSSWQGLGFDTHSSTASPNVNSSYVIASASGSAYQAGVNLTSLGSTTLNADKAGIARPATGAWDIGAYEFSTSAIPAPAGVHLVPSN